MAILGVVLVMVVGAFAMWRFRSTPAGELVQVSAFGDNPTGLDMHLYVPSRVAPNPPLLLALHWCTGSGPQFYASTRYAQLADRLGFIVIYPSATRAGHCWDVHSPAALTHGGGSDPRGLLSMIDYVVQTHHADRGQVFVTGHSSGGMMTQLLLAAYPDVFRAGASSAGVPFGCFASTDEWNEQCAHGEVSKSPQEWAALVHAAWPAFQGRRPSVQLWHGTEDDTLHFANFGESIKQWTEVLATGQSPAAVDANTPLLNWTRQRFVSADGQLRVEAISAGGGPHDIKVPEEDVLRFFGLLP